MKKSKKLTKVKISKANIGGNEPTEKVISKTAKGSKALEPYTVSTASTSTTAMRRNVAGSIERTNRFANIDEGLVPFRNSSTIYGTSESSVDVRDAVILCQKCYYNFALFRNIIDLMTEFSVGNIYLRGGSKQSQEFFKALFNKINLWAFQDEFYREYFRSGNVFIYRFDSNVDPGSIKKITQTYGAKGANVLKESFFQKTSQKENPYGPDNEMKDSEYLYPEYRCDPDHIQDFKMKVPARYIVLNPADIQMMSTLNFAWGMYFKILTDYEVARLRTPKTQEDIDVFKTLPKVAQDAIKLGTRVIAVPLDPHRVSMVFYKKQSYEPFAVPMGYPVLEDINFKAELKKIDMAISRTMQQIVLLVTCGFENKQGELNINQKNLDSLKNLFANQSVGRVLVADFTTEAKFVVPDIGELLNPEKYEIVNNDINVGLNNVFAGGEKFANQQQRVELFMARLEQARQSFLTNFLQPEIKRIAESIGFKNYPTAYVEDIKLKDNTNNSKIYAQLLQLGLLTPEQGIRAIQDNVLPDTDVMTSEQQTYKTQRENGLYQPLLGGAPEEKDPTGNPPGQPKGKQTGQKKVGPIGGKASIDETKFSLSKIKENMLLAQQLEEKVVNTLKEKFKLKRMSKEQKEVAASTVELIMANEESSKWLKAAEDYCNSPVDKNNERVLEVHKVAETHNLDFYMAGLLYASKI